MPPPCYKIIKALERADEIISSSIKSCHPREWNEDYITYSWLSRLRNEASTIRLPKYTNTDVNWDAYKLTGCREENNGDIAFIVKVTFENGNSLSGVAFLEAKRIYDSGKYDALKWAQLKHLSNKSYHHHLLLYDYEAQKIQNTLSYRCCCWNHPFDYVKTNGIVIPTLHALAYEDKHRSLSSIGFRLSEQIFLRYFRGLDLNFDQSLVDNIKAGVVGGINYLAVAHVAIGKERNAELSLNDVMPNENSGFTLLSRNDD